MSGYYLILSTVPDEQKGQEIARELVRERLAACVTVSPACRSFYWWEEKLTEDTEYMLYIKTKASLYAKLEAKLKALHPYSVPEIIALPIVKGHEKYLSWLNTEVKD
ncbi:MAG: divalent-cation tolerance protein CutA [Candidatus Aminicenantales bacterium]